MTQLIEIKPQNVLAAFTADDGLNPIIEKIQGEVSNFEHDLSTAAGRKRTASLANNVAKAKVKLDDLGKDLVSDWKAKAKVVDVVRKDMRDTLDLLKVEARKPLTEWEAEQEALEAARAEKLRLEELAKEVEQSHELALLLNANIDREIEEQKQADERQRIEEERLKIEREEKLKQEAAQQARLEAEQKAKEEKEKIELEKQEAIRREQLAIEQAEQAKKDKIAVEERAKIEAEMAAKAAKEKEIRRQKDEKAAAEAEEKKREANKRHVGKIRTEAKESIMKLGIDESTAKKLVLAINAGKIQHVSITY